MHWLRSTTRKHSNWLNKVQNLRENDEDTTLRGLTNHYGTSAVCIIFPDDRLYAFWSGLIIVIMIYTATVVPYKAVFVL